MTPRITTWTETENAYLMSTCGKRSSISDHEWPAIAKGMGTNRTPDGCKQQFHKLRRTAKGIAPKARIRRRKTEIVADMQSPLDLDTLPQHTSLTAAFFKDPLPGRSALDQMRAGLA